LQAAVAGEANNVVHGVTITPVQNPADKSLNRPGR
jgi:hypothetical protein